MRPEDNPPPAPTQVGAAVTTTENPATPEKGGNNHIDFSLSPSPAPGNTLNISMSPPAGRDRTASEPVVGEATERISIFRLGLSVNVYATLFSCLLYVPTYIEEEDYLSLKNSFGFVGIVFWISLMTCSFRFQNTRSDGHFTVAQELVTDASLCFFTTLAVFMVVFSLYIATLHYLVEPDDSSTEETMFSFLLSFYAGAIPSASCFLLLMLARTSPQTTLGKEVLLCWGTGYLCVSWGCMESRKTFYQIHSIYAIWTAISICSLIVFGAEFLRTATLISGIRLVVCLISAILDVIFVFLSRFAMKHAFVLLPVIQKVCIDRANESNRQLKHGPKLALHDRSQFVLTKRESGLHYHRRFKDLTGGRQDDYIQVNKQIKYPNPGDIIVKVALEDAAGKRIPVSHKKGKSTTRRQYDVRIVSEDGSEIAKSLGVADVSNTNTANIVKFGSQRKNKFNAIYGIMRNEQEEALPREVDLAGFIDVPYRRGKMYLQLDLRKSDPWEPLTLPPHDVLVTREGLKLKHSDLRMDCLYSGDLQDSALRRIYDQPRPTLVESRCFPLKVVDEAASRRMQEDIETEQNSQKQAQEILQRQQAATQETLRVHTRLLQTMKCIPAPRLVEEGTPRLKKWYARTVKLTFGCYYCERPGKTIDSTQIKTWGKIVLTAVKSLPAVLEGDAIGIAENLMTLGGQFKDLVTKRNGDAMEGFEELQEQLQRLEEGGGGDVSSYASLPLSTMRELEEKLRTAGWFDEYDSDDSKFMWKCKKHIGCYPRPIPLPQVPPQENP